MLFTDSIFFVFFAFCFAVRWSLRGNTAQKYFLLACNVVFYGAWDWRFLFLMGGYILFNHWIAGALHRAGDDRRRRALLWLSVAGNLGVLGFFKYYNFFVDSGSSLLTWLGVRAQPATLSIVLPVGISFITFQALSYVIDVYRRELVPVSLLDFALFKSFFPQLVAGPIVRASAFLPQLRSERRLADVDFRRCLTLFVIGYFKKACVADNLATVIDPVFAEPLAHGARDALLAASGYSVQIYCDFSGYSDMAIAVAGMLGFSLMKNFDAPYLSASIRDFWRRWHISLSSWLRDYLYVPLGGGRKGRSRTYLNLMITMVLGGLWHGANWTFVIWGFAHGLALAVQRAWSELRGNGKRAANAGAQAGAVRPAPALLGWAVTLAWVVACFTLFRCDSLSTFLDLCSRVGAWDGKNTLSPTLWSLLLLLGTLHAITYFARDRLLHALKATPAVGYAFLLGVSVSVLLFFTPVSSAPFIYFQF
jgi:alginate O-acetyltransferase complex protein AlgI